ncbi:MAG TPA: phosphate/phosphite/phosphonate ABC transporter substrate-binding protein, partial [Coleofasciculaceae cyanobacterium]
ANLKQFGFSVGEVKVASDLETIASWIKAGEVDVYFDSPYPAMIINEKTGAQPILRRWKDGQPDYHTVIFTMSDRKIKSLADLKGKMIGFDEVSSTTGYLLPMNQLLKAGLKPVETSPTNEVVKADEVGYVFSDDDENTIQWVINGKVAAGAVDINSFMEVPEESRKAITILAESEKVARHVVMVKPGMAPQQVEAIKAALMAMDKTPEGKTILKEFEETAKFDEFPTQADIDKMRKLYEEVKNK